MESSVGLLGETIERLVEDVGLERDPSRGVGLRQGWLHIVVLGRSVVSC